MKTCHRPLIVMMLAVIAGYNAASLADKQPIELAISQSWSGDYLLAQLKRLPKGQQKSSIGYLGSSATFEAVWAAFKPKQNIPHVDFDNELVVFHRNVEFYNPTRIVRVTLKDGVAVVKAIETMSARPIRYKVSLAMAVIPRANVKYIQSGRERLAVKMEQ